MAFLTAEWRHLAMLNFLVDPDRLRDRVPRGTELDDWEGQTFVSVVGFMFLKTRVLGLPVPWHVNFEEVNLRFYVRHKSAEGWRRGVVFVRELVPRRLIASVARLAYNEPYAAVPMRHVINDGVSVRYEWQWRGELCALQAFVNTPPETPAEGSVEQFIAEHYWGYCRQRDGRTVEYRVEHPPWRVSDTVSATLSCDVAALYGEEFVEALASPVSAFVAEGSPVKVYRPTVLDV